jgi:hypothetical protein
MGVRDILRTFFGNAAKSVQLQTEMREGIANQADLFNQRMRELVEQQINQSARNEQLLAELVVGLANQTNVINQRLRELIEHQIDQSARNEQLSVGLANQTNVINQRFRELIEQQLNADARREQFLLELWSHRSDPVTAAPSLSIDISIAPIQPLPIPQISLRRPNPVADLMLTRELKTYLDFFRASPNVRRSRLTAESHAILYALIRKTQPAHALAVFRDGVAVSETIARGLCDIGAGQLHLFDDLDHRKSSAIVGLWPDVLRRCFILETGAPAATGPKCSFMLVGGDGAEATLAVLAETLGTLIEPGGLLVVTNVSREVSRKLMSHRPEWRELGASPPHGENRNDPDPCVLVFLR